jgi:hypothetical protein
MIEQKAEITNLDGDYSEQKQTKEFLDMLVGEGKEGGNADLPKGA